VLVNKTVLTTHKFPSFMVLGLGQVVATILILGIGKMLKIVSFPGLARDTFWRVWPLPLFFIGNMMFGLGGTQALSLPMLTVLRRGSILFTMIGEYFVLRVKAGTAVQVSVFLMLFGALVAAFDDLSFVLTGYVFITLNNLCTAAQGVYMKQKLDSKDLGKYGIMFYNSLFMIVPVFLMAFNSGDLILAMNFEGWHDSAFVAQFGLSCVFGFILNYTAVMCTQYNSALTTAVVGCLKNILITYLGMLVGGDYIFSWMNFIGLNISVFGSLVYTKMTLISPRKSPEIHDEGSGGSGGGSGGSGTASSNTV
jgi:solute carrier family 35 protein